MNEVKETLRVLPGKRNVPDPEWRGQAPVQVRPKSGCDRARIVFRQWTCQCDMKPECVKDVRVAPLKQQRVLRRAQARRAAARKFSLVRRRAEPVERPHDVPGKRRDLAGIAARHQGQKPAQTRQVQAIGTSRGGLFCEIRDSRLQTGKFLLLCKPEWRLQRRMQAIATRPLCQRGNWRGKALHVRMGRPRAKVRVPAQPGRREWHERFVRREVVNGKPPELRHD